MIIDWGWQDLVAALAGAVLGWITRHFQSK